MVGRKFPGPIYGKCYLSLANKSDRLTMTEQTHMRKTTRKTNGKSSNGNKTPPKFDLVKQASEIELLLQRAARHELSIHKRLGNSVAAWQDGKVVIIPPEEITISAEG